MYFVDPKNSVNRILLDAFAFQMFFDRKKIMSMVVVSLEFLALAAVVALAGTFLARSADQIAEITRLGRLLIGSVLLASATSLPELTVDVSAVRQGMPDLAAGDLFGSSLMNLLILAGALFLVYRLTH